MATLQKIRNKGPLLMIVVGLALFAFIAEEFFRSIQSATSESKQRVGEVYGKSLSVHEFQNLVDEYSQVVKFTSGMTSLNDEQLTQVRDQVWNTYVNNRLIEHEAEKLGLTVTDEEVQEIINTGASQMLAQTPFRNEQTGRFDANLLKNFLTEYESMKNNATQMPAEYVEYYESLYKYWQFIEKSIRLEALGNKYQTLLAKSILSNPVAAKTSFENRINESDILLAAVPYSSIADSLVEVKESDLKAKYDEMKEAFKQTEESRAIKYIRVQVNASAADHEALKKEMEEYAQQLASGENIAKVVRQSGSLVNYSELPLRKRAIPGDIALQIDTMAVGTQKGPYYNAGDRSLNIVKLLGKVSAPDSVEYRQIQVMGADMEVIKKTADSIMTALNAGTPFDSIAKKYGQTGAKMWLTSANYEGADINADNMKYIKAILNGETGKVQNVALSQANIILQVTNKRAMTTKYDIAIIKRGVEFSRDTYAKAYNDFSQFLAANTTLKEIEKNAPQAGYLVLSNDNLFSYEHNVAGVNNTREALRWIFNEDTDINSISPLYECGNNDQMLVVVLTGIHKAGYRSQEEMKDFLQAEVIKDKKAEKIKAATANWKNISDAKQYATAVVDTVKHVNFSNAAFISSTGSSEPVLSAAVSKAGQNQFVNGIQGNAGVYAFQVIGKNKRAETFNEATEEAQLNNTNMRAISRFVAELYEKAEVKDNRYLFF